MEITKTLFSYEEISENKKSIPVIVVAAGLSSRMKGVNKQLLKIDGIPVIVKTLLKFNNNPYISRIIIVAKEESILDIEKLCGEYKINKVSDIITGGTTRHESVVNGFKMLGVGEDFVLIHDGARPFVTSGMINSVIKALDTADCAVTALSVTDTVKKTDGEDTVVDTVDRNNLFLAQTPQGVNVKKYLSACDLLKNKDFTDDASVMEKAGYKTVVCAGSRLNIKITTPEDIPVAQAFSGILKGESE